MGLATYTIVTRNAPPPSPLALKLSVPHVSDVGNQTLDDAVTPEVSDNGLLALSAESLQLVCSFLAPRDRMAVLSTHPTLAHEPLAPTYATFCGRCAPCDEAQTHLCEQPAPEASSPSFWTSLVRRCGPDGLRALRVAACDAFSASTLCSLDASARAIAFSNLTVLDLNRCTALGSDGLWLLADQCTTLQELRLRDMAVDAAALAQLVANNCATLRVVDLEGCHTLTGADARRLVCCRGLTSLSLAGCYNVENRAIADVVRACPGLTSINIRFCHKVDDRLVDEITKTLPKLRALNLRYCMKVTDVAVGVICDRLPHLTALDLSHCNKITDAAVMRIAASLQELQELRLWACGKLTSVAVEAIAHASRSLEIVDIRSRNRVEAVIGGRDGVQMLVRKRSRASLSVGGGGGSWEPAEEPGVFMRPPTCVVAA